LYILNYISHPLIMQHGDKYLPYPMQQLMYMKPHIITDGKIIMIVESMHQNVMNGGSYGHCNL